MKDSPYLKLSEPNQGCLLALRQIILQFDKDITESIKYGSACFSYKRKIMCYLMVEKKSNAPYILFANGSQMSDSSLESGDRKKMKIFRVSATNDLPLQKIKMLLTTAINLDSV